MGRWRLKLMSETEFTEFKNEQNIVPLSFPEQNEQESWLGCMRGKGKIIGDIISPVEDADNWKVLSE